MNLQVFPKKDLVSTFNNLKELSQRTSQQHLTEYFSEDSHRFEKFSIEFDEIVFDYSKQRIDQTVLKALLDTTQACDLSTWIKRLFSEEPINYTEQRAVKHWALRLPKNHPVHTKLAEQVHEQLERMYEIVEKIHAGQYRGVTGEVIQDVVNIGVGGSDLGPMMVSHALSDFKVKTVKPLKVHFVSTMDGTQLSDLLHQLRPETTLFIISSKSFGTIDTLYNAQTARQWLEKHLGKSCHLDRSHFIGVSTKADKMTEWGICPDNQLLLWDWVGGRYSLWSCIGLPIALNIGVEGFKQLMAGAYTIDEHFCNADYHQNIPVIMAVLGLWNHNYLDIQTQAILPYDGRLKYFPQYLQQLEMESNGKSIQRNGEKVKQSTCPIIWGEVGPNAQHAFYQLLHQGTHKVSCEFIAPVRRYTANQFTYVKNAQALIEQHHLALSNCLAQSRLLAFGNAALDKKEVETLPEYQKYQGNQPSTTILLKELTPYTLGMLIALYEHKVFVQSVLWNINAFDQWGVEKGKQIANEVLPILNGETHRYHHLDSSTRGLLDILLEKEK